MQNSSVQAKVLAWLNDPQVPLGSAQRAAYVAQPPASQRNAYKDATVDPLTGRVNGGGLNPNAIVAVKFSDTGSTSTTFGTGPDEVGIKHPILTGMIRKGDIGTAPFKLVAVGGVDAGGDPPARRALLHDLGAIPSTLVNVDPAQLAGTGSSDWVAFQVTVGAVGRRHDPILTGPNGSGWALADAGDTESLAYQMPDIPNGESPSAQVSLPTFVLPQPAHTGLSVIVSGAVEVDGSRNPQSNEVDIDYQATGHKIDHIIVSVSHAPDPTGTVPWDGLLVPYMGAVQLQRDPMGFVYGQDENTGDQQPQLYQYLKERWGVSNPASLAVGV